MLLEEKEIRAFLFRCYYEGNNHAEMPDNDYDTVNGEFTEWYKSKSAQEWVKKQIDLRDFEKKIIEGKFYTVTWHNDNYGHARTEASYFTENEIILNLGEQLNKKDKDNVELNNQLRKLSRELSESVFKIKFLEGKLEELTVIELLAVKLKKMNWLQFKKWKRGK